ncbi:unnamed protein product [Rotaria sordida]|uniref:Uncharacterized protein n=1 Tax=Rotaria sordida TaxID=392033 RepID=A0A813NVE5_9BILA|nr:unnamed protein product [Rotaria sordida]CAF0741198.1 unnamed protein product [Rotaria sordida]
MGDYSKALEFYDKSHQILEKALPPTHPDWATSYNNIGLTYNKMGVYSKALEFYEKAHQIKEKALPPHHPHLASSYNNIGGVSISPNHPDLATSYNNISSTYHGLGNYAAAPKATTYAFQIRQNAFQEDNLAFAFTYNWALAIFQQMLPERHPNLAIIYSNIGDIHRLMGDYERTLSFHRKVLNIQENVRCNPLECATTYTNLDETYREMKDYSTALTYFEKGLEIR